MHDAIFKYDFITLEDKENSFFQCQALSCTR